MEIEGYLTKERIYESTCSVVFQAERLLDHQPVILKVLKTSSKDPLEQARLRWEYEILKKLKVEGVPKAFGYFEHHDLSMIVEEDLGGVSLSKILSGGKPKLTLREFLQLAIEIARALGEIHRQHVIHKNLNPANILWNRETGKVLIVDFGIASLLAMESLEQFHERKLEGTLAYISPEQTGRMNRSVDSRSDIYSLGITFYELLAGHPPFVGSDVMELVHSHIAKAPVPLSQACRDVPLGVSKIVQKMVSKMADDRYQSALGLQTDLERCLEMLDKGGEIKPFQLGEYDLVDQLRIPQKLYGREKEIRLLRAAFEDLGNKETQLLLVTGYAGVGKSSVVNEINRTIFARRGILLSGKFDQLHRNLPYSTFVQGLRKIIHGMLTEDKDRMELLKRKLSAALEANGGLISELIPELELIIGPQQKVAELPLIETQNRFHAVFLKFLLAIGSGDHPLVIFLDDLQWVDSASLAFLEFILTHPDTRGLLVVATYRENEVDLTHPLTLTLKNVEKHLKEIQSISLKPLAELDVRALLSDTFRSDSQDVADLTRICYEKTQGNPFFLSQFLESLHDEALIRFDPSGKRWVFDLPGIRQKKVTDNVADLMVEKIQKLSAKSQELIRIASCVGNTFTLRMLARCTGLTQEEVGRLLQEPLEERIILPQDSVYKYVEADSEISYAFLHDRVQQVAYSLLSDEEKRRIHANMGRLLLEEAGKNEDLLFAVVNHLNLGKDHLRSGEEKLELARLNLHAAKKAMESAAFETGLNYLRHGLSLKQPDWWEERYELTLGLLSEAANAAYINKQYEEMDHYAAEVHSRAKDVLDEINVYETEILAKILRDREVESVRIGLSVLGRLGEPCPEKVSVARILSALLRVKLALRGKDVRALENAADLTDRRLLAVSRITTDIGPSAYLVNPELYVYLVFRLTLLSLKHGNSPYAGVAYSGCAVLHCSLLKDIELGYQFGRLCLEIAEKYQAHRLKSFLRFVFTNFVAHWKVPLKDTLAMYLESYKLGVDNGDNVFATFSGTNYCYHAFFAGNDLEALSKDCRVFTQFNERINRKMVTQTLKIYHQAVEKLRTPSADPTRIVGEIYDEDRMLPLHVRDNERLNVFDVHLNKLVLSCFFQDYAEAVRVADLARVDLDVVRATHAFAAFHFYDSLALLGHFSELEPGQRRKAFCQVAANQKNLRRWVRHCSVNQLHRYHLVEAERMRVRGQSRQAEELYERAIEEAEANELNHEAALAFELAGRFHLALGKKRVAGTYLKEAMVKYRRWGALSKVDQLSRHQLIAQFTETVTEKRQIDATVSTETSLTLAVEEGALDYRSLLKASMAISGELISEQLNTKLMKTIIENAGAERGYLILVDPDNSLFIESYVDILNEEGVSTSRMRIETCPDLSRSVVRYVFRTQKDLVLADAGAEDSGIIDDYIEERKPKSILCTPVLHNGRLSGIIYLENNKTTHAFTPNHVELMHILSAQAAVSMDNAKLYSQLKESSLKLSQALEEAKESDRIKTEFLARTSHELRTPLNPLINIPRGLLDDFKEIAIAQCGSCLQLFQLAKDEEITPQTACLNCQQKGTLQRGRRQEWKGDSEELHHHLSSMAETGTHLLKIVQDILDISKLEAGKITLNPAPVTLGEVLEEALSALQHQAKEKGIQITKPAGLEQVQLVADSLRMTQILYNLIGNAIKFSRQGSRVDIGLEQKKDSIVLTVQDQGIGIARKNQALIFESFRQVDGGATRRYGGTGLGLAITRKLVELHGGRIWVESEEGQGSAFHIEIPQTPIMD